MVFLFYMTGLFRLLLMGDLLKKTLWRLRPILLINRNYSST